MNALNFIPIKWSHKPIIEKLIALERQEYFPYTYLSCQYVFANLYSLQDQYQSQIAFYKNAALLMIPSKDDSQYEAYRFPFGVQNDKREMIHLLLKYLKKRERKCLFYNVTEEQKNFLAGCKACQWRFKENHDWDEYIYKIDKYELMPGKKLRKKRQQMQYFWDNYGALTTVEVINEYNLPGVKSFQQQWMENYLQIGINDQSLIAENEIILQHIQYFHELGMKGIILKVGERIVGYTYGVIINDMLDIIVQKADRMIRGSYAALTREFAMYAQRYQCDYMNMEEDIGIEGLKQLKRSYAPDILLKKYVLYEI